MRTQATHRRISNRAQQGQLWSQAPRKRKPSRKQRYNRPKHPHSLTDLWHIIRSGQSRFLSVLLIIFASASAVAVFGLVVATSTNRDSAGSEIAPFALDHRVKPSLLHFGRLTAAQKRNIAGQVHFISQKISDRTRKSPAKTKQLALTIFSEAYRAGVDPLLITSVIQTESAFRHTAKSNRYAYGLMQIQPVTGKFAASLVGERWKGSSQLLYDKPYNLRLGIAYLKYLRDRFDGDLDSALMAYNWGPTNFDEYRAGRKRVPSSVKHYAKTITDRHMDFHLSFTDTKSQYQFMNASYVPEKLWSALLTKG